MNETQKPQTETKPKCFATLKPLISCVGCKFGIECIKAHESEYMAQIHRG